MRRRIPGRLRSDGLLRHAVALAVPADPADPLGVPVVVVRVQQVGLQHRTEQPVARAAVQPGQPGALVPSRRADHGAHRGRDLQLQHRPPVGAPPVHLGIQLGHVRAVVPLAEEDPYDDLRALRVGRDRVIGVVPEHRGGDPHVERGSAEPDADHPPGRVLRRQRALLVEQHVHHVARHLEPPRLGVVHRRRGPSRVEQDAGLVRGQRHSAHNRTLSNAVIDTSSPPVCASAGKVQPTRPHPPRSVPKVPTYSVRSSRLVVPVEHAPDCRRLAARGGTPTSSRRSVGKCQVMVMVRVEV